MILSSWIKWRDVDGSSAILRLLLRFSSVLLCCATCLTRNTYPLAAVDQGQKGSWSNNHQARDVASTYIFHHTRNEDSATTWIAPKGTTSTYYFHCFLCHFCARKNTKTNKSIPQRYKIVFAMGPECTFRCNAAWEKKGRLACNNTCEGLSHKTRKMTVRAR